MDVAIPEFVTNHWQACVIGFAVVVVIIIIGTMYWYGWFDGITKGSKKTDRVLESMDEFDRLIDSIHAKQGLKKGSKR